MPDAAGKPPASTPLLTAWVALTGNPNSGKTTVFNALTGLRAKVGNYAGVTVERKEGRIRSTPPHLTLNVIDLPGTYSLSPQSLDEQISRDVLFQRLEEVPGLSAVVVVVDASNLERNLYYATQVIELGYPAIVALNMVDVASENGHDIDAGKLAESLGVPVIPTVASTGKGVSELRAAIIRIVQSKRPEPSARLSCRLPGPLQVEVQRLSDLLGRQPGPNRVSPTALAQLLLADERILTSEANRWPESLQTATLEARARLERAGVDWRTAFIEARYGGAAEIHAEVTTERLADEETFSDRLDRVLTHRVWGSLILTALMLLMFQSIFVFARYPMEALEAGVAWAGDLVGRALPPGDLRSLIVDGMVAGVGAVVVFLPQICLLFLFIGLLEDTGYMARAAFIMDRLMSKVGLHGKSFIPMLSSFACAIPGIMATRTIETPKDRLVTILIAPLMTCSARLPVYALLIAACIPDRSFAGIFRWQGMTLLAMYLLGILAALASAWVFKQTLLRGHAPMLIMELPPYRVPLVRIILRHMWDRSKLFLRRAGTVILGINILLWFFASYPRNAALEQDYAERRARIEASAPVGVAGQKELDARRSQLVAALAREEASAKLRHSFAGRLGQLIAPVIAPLGFDWSIGVGIITSFAAREVFVSTMATVYSVGNQSDRAGARTLAETLKLQHRADGTPLYTMRTALALMVFYVFALQCVSTVAITRRETNSWRWPALQWAYMGLLAWLGAFITWHGGKLLGLP